MEPSSGKSDKDLNQDSQVAVQDSSPEKVTLDAIKNILAHSTPEYQHIKALAEKDLGKELIERIEKFLEERKHDAPKELKKIIFEDASKVKDQNINDIVDAFVKMRSASTLAEVDSKSINDILILFNQWVAIGKGQQESFVPGSIAEIFFEPQAIKGPQSLEEQLTALKDIIPKAEEIYRSQPLSIGMPSGSYSSDSREEYGTILPPAQFISGEHLDDRPYRSGALYKIH